MKKPALKLTIYPENADMLRKATLLHENTIDDAEWLANKILSEQLDSHLSCNVPLQEYQRGFRGRGICPF